MRGKISVALAVLLFLSTGILPTRAEETILKVIQSISTVVTAETKGEQHSESAEMNETQDPIIEDSESDQKLDEIKNETKEETLDENVAQSTGEADGSITESEAELNSANGKEQVAQTEGMDSTSDTNVVLDVKEPINNFDDISTNNHSTDTSDAFVEPLNQSVVYVDAVKGSDDNVGSDAAPLKTIQAAIKKVDGPSGQIELLSDVMLSSYVIIDGKTITIDGGNHTVSRGENFIAVNDGGRGGYNPAMFEIANGSVVTFSNIVLDDQYRHEGTKYLEQSTSDKNNKDLVQDAIIAMYSADEHNGQIILDSGAIIQNYGGMSAIRVTSQNVERDYQVIMRSGSEIRDTLTYSAETQLRGFGAIWSQGGKILVEEGAKISSINGTAIYCEDGAHVDFGGELSNLAFYPMTYGRTSLVGPTLNDGYFAIAVRGNSVFNLNQSAQIHDIDLRNGNVTAQGSIGKIKSTVLFFVTDSSIVSEAGSVIEMVNNGGLFDNNGGRITVNGSIQNCKGSSNVLFRIRGAETDDIVFTLAPTGVLDSLNSSDVGIFYVGRGNVVVQGEIINCESKDAIIYLEHNHAWANLYIEDGAYAANNTAEYIFYSNFKNAIVMNGGTIENNNGFAFGVKFSSMNLSTNSLDVNGGIIQNNNGGGPQIRLREESVGSTIDHDRVKIQSGSLIGNTFISSEKLHFEYSVDENSGVYAVGLANPTIVSNTSTSWIQQWALKHPNYPLFTDVSNYALWFRPSTSHFTITIKSDDIKNSVRPVYAFLLPVNQDGTSVTGKAAEDGHQYNPKMVELHESGETISVSFDGLDINGQYVLVFVTTADYVVSPSDITIYTGGYQGDADTTYCDIGDSAQCNGGLPVENYTLDGLPSKAKVIAQGREFDFTTKQELEYYLKNLLTIEFQSSDGTKIENDSLSGEYRSILSWKDDNQTIEIVDISSSDQTARNIQLASGELIIRHVQDLDGATTGDVYHDALTQSPDETTPLNESVVVLDENTTIYTNNDPQLSYNDLTGIALMDDALLEGDDNRTLHLQQRTIDVLESNGIATDGLQMHYDFHYLDLVDTHNANAWVSSSKPVDVYLPYPQGLTPDMDFYVLHFKDLHREYGIAGEADVIDAINNSDVEFVHYDSKDNWIQFSISQSGFSPFLIVWMSEPGDNTNEQPSTPDTGTWDDGGPFTSDECGSVYDRWGNLIYQGICGVTTGFQLVNTSDH